jgi:hypothetical protein
VRGREQVKRGSRVGRRSMGSAQGESHRKAWGPHGHASFCAAVSPDGLSGQGNRRGLQPREGKVHRRALVARLLEEASIRHGIVGMRRTIVVMLRVE